MGVWSRTFLRLLTGPVAGSETLQELLRVLNRQTGADPTRVQEVRQRLQQDVRELGKR